MIHARLDRKTGTKVLCGGSENRCPGELGTILDTRPWTLMRPDRTFHQYPQESRLVATCPRCGQDVLVDLLELELVTRRIREGRIAPD